ncbi:MAG: XdhC family protein [Planctomycetaceae bacterium]|nr:XdhC family protein [Planctomycetaceae bacterium]
MQELLRELIETHENRKACVLCQLAETRGSTPQKAGAAMLVRRDGSQSGTLGGGCVEADVKRTAIEKLVREMGDDLVTLTLDHDYGWDDGLICGGRMTSLVSPITPQSDISYYRKMLELVEAKVGWTEAISLCPKEHGVVCRVLFGPSGNAVATIGETEWDTVKTPLRPLRGRPRPYVENNWAYLPNLPICRLVIVGAGHVGQKVAHYAKDVDFDVWVLDDRADFCQLDRFPSADRLIVGSFDEVLPNLEVDEQTFCIIVTRGHNHDEEALFHLIRKSPRYLGMIGSKRKIRMIFDDLRREGIPDELLEHVHAPIGLDIGSRTVPEIAIAIVAQLIAIRNGHDELAKDSQGGP